MQDIGLKINKARESSLCPMKFAVKKKEEKIEGKSMLELAIEEKSVLESIGCNNKFYKTNYIIGNMTILLRVQLVKKQTLSTNFSEMLIEINGRPDPQRI